MSENPYGTQPPGQYYPQHPDANKSGTKTVLIVLGIVGGVLLLAMIACGVGSFMLVRNAKSGFEDVMAEAMAELEAEQQAESQFWVDAYSGHPLVRQQIGEVTSHQARDMDWNDEFLELEIEVRGEKGSGQLRIEYADSSELTVESENNEYETRMNAYFVNQGNKQLLDSEAGKKYDAWLESEY